MTGDPHTYAIIGAAIAVHGELGCGFLEAVYAEALRMEFGIRMIPYASEVPLPLYYRRERLTTSYRVDLICYGEIIVELKALREIGGGEAAQVLNYLKASGMRKGLLLNFGTTRLEHRRMVWG